MNESSKKILKQLQDKKAALQKEFWFNQELDMKEYLTRYNALNSLIRPLEFEETFNKNNEN
tara:strand:- start:70 stop:252 length:183 start_codon:yes stop_codon:yes gene_type:complete